MGTNVLQIVGYKNTGKTTLTESLIKRLVSQRLIVGAIKHDGHDFETDHPGTDTWRHRQAGAVMTAITSGQRTAMIEERPTPLHELLERFHSMDIVLVEGFKFEPYPKIVIVKTPEDEALITRLENVSAVASWYPLGHDSVPVFHIDDADGMLEWIRKRIITHKPEFLD